MDREKTWRQGVGVEELKARSGGGYNTAYLYEILKLLKILQKNYTHTTKYHRLTSFEGA